MHERADLMYPGAFDYDFEKRPKRDFLRFNMNPYNGRVSVTVCGPLSAVKIATDIVKDMAVKMEQLSNLLGRETDLSDYMNMLDGGIDFDGFNACPFCGQQPSYDEERHEIVCCGGHARYYDFADKADAVRFWNVRSGKVA